jgi:hypothetical protein
MSLADPGRPMSTSTHGPPSCSPTANTLTKTTPRRLTPRATDSNKPSSWSLNANPFPQHGPTMTTAGG